MKKNYLVVLFTFLAISGYSQVGINTIDPSAASVLDVRSSRDGTNYGGFLPPRVSLSERAQIPVTAADDGMMVFLQDGDTRCVQIWNGVDLQWEDVFCMPSGGAGGIFISEIADPDNNANARFIEVTNGSSSSVILNNYELRIYSNGNTSAGGAYVFSNTIAPGTSYVIATNSSNFSTAYGFPPDDSFGSFNSNGNDTFELVDSSGTTIDIFGIIGTDGTGTCAEFEDGRVLRLSSITTGNPVWDESEWSVWSDSNISGCTANTNAPQDAPADFSPGSHPN